MKNLFFSLLVLLATAFITNINAKADSLDSKSIETPSCAEQPDRGEGGFCDNYLNDDLAAPEPNCYPGHQQEEEEEPNHCPGHQQEEEEVTSRGGKRVVIHYNNKEFWGSGNILHFKRKIKEQHPHLKLRKFALKGVLLVAKSKGDYLSYANLIVASRHSAQHAWQVVPGGGHPHRFYSNHPLTYHKIFWHNDSPHKRRWHIRLFGHIKVLKVVVFLKKRQL